MPMKSLFLQAPSFDGYDGGAGARYQMKREVKSFWFPTWLAQAAAMVPGSRLIDAPPHNLSFKDIEADVKAHELIVIHTSTPSFKSDIRTAQMVRDINPTAKIGFTDDSPARPGVFLAIEVPGLLAGVPYRIASDPTKPKSTSVLAVRVDPGVKFADHRVAEKGEVTVIPSGDDLLVIAKTTFAEQEQTLQLTVPKAHNGCGPALVF